MLIISLLTCSTTQTLNTPEAGESFTGQVLRTTTVIHTTDLWSTFTWKVISLIVTNVTNSGDVGDVYQNLSVEQK